jgi:hypothetical protein
MQTKTPWRPWRAFASLALAAVPALAAAAHPVAVPLKDAAGNNITATSTLPYSVSQSCGTCHDLNAISQGYHFQQGRTNLTGAVQVSDSFLGALLGYDASGNATRGTGAWWKLSDGMYGKW